MDDGGKLDYNKSSKNKSIVLNTQSFLDVVACAQTMAEELSYKFQIECSVRTNKGKKIIVGRDKLDVVKGVLQKVSSMRVPVLSSLLSAEHVESGLSSLFLIYVSGRRY